MERIKSLGRYEKMLLFLMLVMVLVFTVVYPVMIAREGFLYKDVILVPSENNGSTTYSGEIQGKQAVFTVFAEKSVTFQWGEKHYGPYTAKEDPSAVPESNGMHDSMTGIVLSCGEEVIFRGGMLKTRDYRWLISKDGEPVGMVDITTSGGGIITDEHGNIIDQMEPSVPTILDLIEGPELTHRGSWAAWFFSVLICVFTAISIIYADELFRFSLSFKISNADNAEPTDWAIACRYLAWTAIPIYALMLFINGLQL